MKAIIPRRFAAVAVTAYAAFFATAPASAQTSTGQIKVTLVVQAECKLTSTADVAFGTTGVIQSAITATGTIGVQCTNTTPYNIGLGAGSGAGATVVARKMTAGTGATIHYELYRDTARTLVWGDTVNSNTMAGTGTGVVQTLTVFGRVPVQTTPAAGTYADTVTVTVTY